MAYRGDLSLSSSNAKSWEVGLLALGGMAIAWGA